ncbi:MAG TPA: hypothetical protein VFO11_02485 [Candidatus Polarisedimenticolaceae bacterium]|nr:hypothetical protein [Candidatus Polarisedimenticolaceae bacterium]
MRLRGRRWVLLALLALASASAAHARARRPVELAPPSSRTLRRALARAEVCADPAPARVKVSPGFRYGCFCGGGYPGLARETGKRPKDMSSHEREKLIARYYAVKPVDALDEACRDHDVCWIWNGRHAVACNQAFGSTMRALRGTFKDAGQDRCANLALDMQMAASYVLPSASWWDRAEKVLWSPVTAVQAVIVQSGALRDTYPHRGEVCGR